MAFLSFLSSSCRILLLFSLKEWKNIPKFTILVLLKILLKDYISILVIKHNNNNNNKALFATYLKTLLIFFH